MPKCIVSDCLHRTGQKEKYPHVILHPFPGNLEIIKKWLLQIGDDYVDIDALAVKILEGKKYDNYRICSMHFDENQYIYKTHSKSLRKDAVPTLFPKISSLFKIQSITGPPPCKKRRVDDPDEGPSAATIVRIVSHSRTVSTQTEPEYFLKSTAVNTDHTFFMESKYTQCEPPIQKKDMQIQTGDDFVPAEKWIIEKDHFYPVCFSTPTKATIFNNPLCQSENEIFQEISPVYENKLLEDTLETTYPTIEDLKDTTFNPQDCTSLEMSDVMDSSVNEVLPVSDSDFVRERKFIVFETQLDLLLKLIPCQFNDGQMCPAPISKIHKTVEGSMVTVNLTCRKLHNSLIWKSQPTISNMPVGNILMSSSILLSGSSFQKVKEMFDLFGIAAISKTTFYKNQNHILFPAIDNYWKKEQQNIFTEIGDEAVVVAGDGQFDSPGHSAKYCIYSFMDILSDKIVDFKCVQVEPGKTSSSLEVEAFTDCMENLLTNKVQVKIVATDRHSSVKRVMSKKYSKIEHQFDIWHLCKSVSKKLKATSKLRNCKDLVPWITSIQNHLWWCAQTCMQNADLLIEKWQSVMFHVADVHKFPSFKKYKKCMHGRISQEQRNGTNWIMPSHPAHSALQKIVNDKALLADLRQVTKFCHTGQLEVYHSKCLKYRSKRYSYRMNSMYARTTLAALSNNRNVGRSQATVTCPEKTTLTTGEKRYKLVFPKQKKDWVAKPIYKACVDDHLFEITNDCLKIQSGALIHSWTSQATHVPKSIASKERPDRETLIQRHLSRFK
ncbi:uncharacterized protein LOC121397046 [Xenopus laevis]|uniref:Uncharacterized protein LOC121397046 n=1 Tax=Xenopus laevis TaxID=8355 RepID=A0A8J1LGV8_XENLA|nr:uncharacterized protein LOC121397046 [Xenopus laevis]XP_041428793.1 uncharacterized protein LOC121397046 [Xenopus laevis]